VDFIASFLEGNDEFLVALGDVPGTVDDDEGRFEGGHGSCRWFFLFFYFFCCVLDTHTRNPRILKRIDTDRSLASAVYQRLTTGGMRLRGMSKPEEGEREGERGSHGIVCGGRLRWVVLGWVRLLAISYYCIYRYAVVLVVLHCQGHLVPYAATLKIYF
jgi:hypothetical protein